MTWGRQNLQKTQAHEQLDFAISQTIILLTLQKCMRFLQSHTQGLTEPMVVVFKQENVMI